jgi:GABA permease
MRNPFKSEDAAFRFLMLAIGYLGLIAVAYVINRWFGLVVFLLATGAIVTWWLMSRGGEDEQAKQAAPPRPPGEKRLLVVANETVAGAELLSELKQHARGRKTKVLVVVPAFNTKLEHRVSDDDGARATAAERLAVSLEAMRVSGITARGEVGDSDPLQAIDDSLRTFAPDEIVISTHPAGRSNWLERGVVESARERFDVPVVHVVVDLSAAPAPAEAAEAG